MNSKGGNNMGHAIAVTTRSEKCGEATTSNQKKIVDEEQLVQEDEMESNKVRANDEVRIDIDDNVEETQEKVNPSREHIVDIPELVLAKADVPMPRPPPPYPQRLAKQNVKALEQMSGYAKFMKDLVTKKRSMNCETIKMTHQVSAIVHSMAPKLEDPGAFTIPCTIGSADFAKALCDLGRPLGIIDDVLVRVDKFILPVDYEVPIILSRPFLATGKSLVDVEAGELTFRMDDGKVVFHVCKSMRQPNSIEVCLFVDLVIDVIIDDASATMNVEDNLEAVLLNLDNDEKKEGYV
uniref:Uncharacterized protein LOC104240586 n=1 Tax=Nicotiana sylvestris TaxID=4096 RepID=A0A1U7XVU2_NICSY|nr:PREDICTED: uncharacterized protein LOC104240586 [Nicotiana sylvestris]